MKKKPTHEPECDVLGENWTHHREGVFGDERNTGIYRVAEGECFDPSGTKRSGVLFGINWIVKDDVFSCVLLKCEDGRSTFLRAVNDVMVVATAKAAFDRLDSPAYSSCDPILDAHLLTAGFIRNCAGDLVEMADQVRPHVESFLAENYNQDVLNTKIGRSVTAKEYVFLAQNERRRQAIEAMPWLLTLIISEYGTPFVTELMRVIDGGEELIPALCARFGVGPSVIRSMAEFPAPAPNAFRLGERKAADAHTIILALAQIVPEQRPDKGRVRRFVEVMAWAETVIREAGDQASRSAVATATAEIWKRLLRRPYSLPSYADVAWLEEMAQIVKELPNVENRVTEGVLCGVKKSFHPHLWAVLYCVCRWHPTDLAMMGREWNRREMAYVRHHVREAFPSNFPITSEFPESFVAKNGWECRRISTVGKLVDEAAAAMNCLAGYVPQMLRHDVAVYSMANPDGETEGHMSFEPDENGQISVGQVKRYRNRKALPAMKAAAAEFIESVSAAKGNDFPPPLSNKAAFRDGMRMAVSAVDSAKAIAHNKTVEEILTKAAERYSINQRQEQSR